MILWWEVVCGVCAGVGVGRWCGVPSPCVWECIWALTNGSGPQACLCLHLSVPACPVPLLLPKLAQQEGRQGLPLQVFFSFLSSSFCLLFYVVVVLLLSWIIDIEKLPARVQTFQPPNHHTTHHQYHYHYALRIINN